MSTAELVLPIVCWTMVQIGRETFLSFLIIHSLWEEGELILGSCPSPAASLERVDPAPHLDSKIELVLFVEVAEESTSSA